MTDDYFHMCLQCSHLSHKNLVQMIGLVFKGSALQYIVMEVMGKVCTYLCPVDQ